MKIKWILNLVIATFSLVLLSCGGGGSSDNSRVQIQQDQSTPDTTTHELVINIEQDGSGFVISCPVGLSCDDDDILNDEDSDDAHDDSSDNQNDDENDHENDDSADNQNDDDSDSDDHDVTSNHSDDDDDSDIQSNDGDGSVQNLANRAYKFENEDVYFYLSLNPAIINNYSLAAFKENFEYFNMQIFFPEKETSNSKFYFTNKTPMDTLAEPSIDGIKFTIIDFVDNKLKGKIEGTITSITERMESDESDCITDDIAGICFNSEEANIPFTINFNLTVE